MIDLSNFTNEDDDENAPKTGMVQSAKQEENNLSQNTQSQVQRPVHLEQQATNPIDDVERLLQEIGDSPRGSARDKGEDGEGENEGDLTRLVDKI